MAAALVALLLMLQPARGGEPPSPAEIRIRQMEAYTRTRPDEAADAALRRGDTRLYGYHAAGVTIPGTLYAGPAAPPPCGLRLLPLNDSFDAETLAARRQLELWASIYNARVLYRSGCLGDPPRLTPEPPPSR